ncbi:unnamed protein product [Somion occarium]|uniref:PX domain-containing protein n=1 Tax=Somion occarium TaxID=3059160 RepID=A0ABP1CF99_9APHY
MDSRGRSRDISPAAFTRKQLHTPLVTPSIHADFVIPQYHSSVSVFASAMWQQPPSPEPIPVPSSSRLMLPPATASPSPPFTYPHLACHSPSRSPTPSLPPSPTDSFMLRTNSSSTLSVSPEATPSGPLTPPDSVYAYSDRDYYDSSPLPPRTLQDQMQDAYALDNMHLAKILLLKLRGIEVTSDDDPRIAQVKDADFSTVFVPPGGLKLSPEDEKRYQEGVRRENERRRRAQREARLRICEKIWENSVRCLREQKTKLARRKEDELRERRKLEIEARGREREARERDSDRECDILARYTRQLKVSTCSNQRSRLSYGSLPASSSRSVVLNSPSLPMPTFEYTLMPPVHTLSTSRHSPPSSLASSPPKNKSPLSSPHRAFKELSALSAQNIPFSTVVTRMHGPLFPEDNEDEDDTASTSSVRRLRIQRRTVAQVHLFDELLKRDVSQWQERADGRPRVGSSLIRRRTQGCPACSQSLSSMASTLVSSSGPSTSATSTSSSTRTISTRSNSWFSSFSSILTPSLTSSSSLSSSTSDALPSTTSTTAGSVIPVSISVIPSSKEAEIIHHHTLHTCSQSKLIPLAPEDPHPLSVPLTSSSSRTPFSSVSVPSRGRALVRPITTTSSLTSLRLSPTPTEGEREGEGLVWKMTRRFTRFIDMASQFQKAYVRATMFSTGSDLYGRGSSLSSSAERSYSRERDRLGRTVYGSEGTVWDRRGRARERGRGVSANMGASAKKMDLKPRGYRVSPCDLQIFTSADLNSPESNPTRPFLPLHTLSPPTSPSSPSYPLRFPQPPPIPRSPFRSPYPPQTLTSRLRPIANPLLLRMRALQNRCMGVGADNYLEDGHVVGLIAGNGGVMEVREKVVGVAWDGIGRSGLGCEVCVR